MWKEDDRQWEMRSGGDGWSAMDAEARDEGSCRLDAIDASCQSMLRLMSDEKRAGTVRMDALRRGWGPDEKATPRRSMRTTDLDVVFDAERWRCVEVKEQRTDVREEDWSDCVRAVTALPPPPPSALLPAARAPPASLRGRGIVQGSQPDQESTRTTEERTSVECARHAGTSACMNCACRAL